MFHKFLLINSNGKAGVYGFMVFILNKAVRKAILEASKMYISKFEWEDIIKE